MEVITVSIAAIMYFKEIHYINSDIFHVTNPFCSTLSLFELVLATKTLASGKKGR